MPSRRPSLDALVRTIYGRRVAWLGGLFATNIALAVVAFPPSLRVSRTDWLPTNQVDERPAVIPGVFDRRNDILVVLDSPEALDQALAERVMSFLASEITRVSGVTAARAGPSPEERRFVEAVYPKSLLLYVDPDTLPGLLGRLDASSIRSAAMRMQDKAGLDRDPLDLLPSVAGSLRGRWEPGSRVMIDRGLFSLPDRRTFFLEVETEVDEADVERSRQVVLDIEQTLNEARSHPSVGPLMGEARLYAAGFSVSLSSTVDRLLEDLIRVAAATGLIVLLILWASFGRLVPALALLATVGTGLLVTAAAAKLAFGSLSLVTWVVIVFLLGLGVDFGIYILIQHSISSDARDDQIRAITSALTLPGPAILVAGLTSAVALGSVSLIPSIVTREIGILGSFGMGAILICSLSVLPLFLCFGRARPRPLPVLERWTGFWAKSAGRRNAPAAVGWLLLFALGVGLTPGIPLDDNPRFIWRHDPHTVQLDSLVERAGVAFPPLVLVSRGSTRQEAMSRDREAVQRVLDIGLGGGVSAVQSLSRWVPAPASQQANLAQLKVWAEGSSPTRVREEFIRAFGDLDARPFYRDEYLPAIERSLEPTWEPITVEALRRLGLDDLVDRHLVRHGNEYLAASFIHMRRPPGTAGEARRFTDLAREKGVYDIEGVTLKDPAMVTTDQRGMFRESAAWATLIALALVLTILLLRFRKASLVLLCIVPVAASLSAAVIVIGLLGLEVSLLTLTIAPILVGIAIDDGIHIVDRLESGHAFKRAMRDAGSPMTLTTATSVAAFACLGLATFPGVRELGIIGACSLIVALLASLHLVPIGWQLLNRNESTSA